MESSSQQDSVLASVSYGTTGCVGSSGRSETRSRSSLAACGGDRSSAQSWHDQTQIRAFAPSDRDGLVGLLEGLSETSRFYRFQCGCPRLPASVVRSLCQVDDHSHIALVAVAADRIVGEARCVRLMDDSTCAELAISVADALQGRGIGRRLLQVLARRAATRGITTFSAEVLLENRRVIELLARRGATLLSRAGAVGCFRVPASRGQLRARTLTGREGSVAM